MDSFQCPCPAMAAASRMTEEIEVMNMVHDLLDDVRDRQAAEMQSAAWAAQASDSEHPSSIHGSSEENFSPPSQHCKTSSWWAPVVKHHLRECAYHIDNSSSSGLGAGRLETMTKNVISACSGSCAEAEVLKVSWLFQSGIWNAAVRQI